VTMNMIEGDRRPYAATANVIAVINRARTRNLPEKVNNDYFRIAGIGAAVFGRVNFALEFLGLISSDGTPSDKLRAMASAPEAEFKELLAGTIREAYAGEFTRVDPGEDSQAQVHDAFRRYQPKSQIDRMVMLFLGLCREAGIPVRDVPRDRKMQSPSTPRKSTSVLRRPSHSAARGGEPTTKNGGAPLTTGMLFGVTEADVANLTDEDFNEVWSALGKVARARSRARASVEAQDAGAAADDPAVDDE
jgi:hypothetical protein